MRRTVAIVLFALATLVCAETKIYTSFNAGEVAPDLYHPFGSRAIENMFVWPHGPVSKRPGTKYVSPIEVTIPAVPEVPAVPQTYTMTYISENGKIWAVPVGDGEMLGGLSGAARDVGGGAVGLTYTGHPFTVGEQVALSGTTNYNDYFTLQAGTTANELHITSGYTAESFDGSERVVKHTGSLTAGAGRMAQDADGNLYYAHNWDGTSLVTRISTDGTQENDFLTTTWPYVKFSGASGMGICVDATYLYIMIYQTSPAWAWMEKYVLATGVIEWSTEYTFGTFDLSIDADGNAYTADFSQALKFASADGARTTLTNRGGQYVSVVDDDIGIMISAGTVATYNLWVTSLADTDVWDGILVGTELLGTAHVATNGEYIYVLGNDSGTPTLYKLSWDGSSVTQEASANAPATHAQGIYFDLYGNLVVIRADYNTTVADQLHFYDTDLNFVTSIDNFSGVPWTTWDAPTGSSWLAGNIVFNGDLGTPAIPGTPERTVGTTLGDNNEPPARLVSFEDDYVVGLVENYMIFYRDVP